MARHLQASLLAALIAFTSLNAVMAGTIRYNRDIRPILSDQCFFCHGPDKNKRKADLRLDIREEALKTTKDHEAAFVPGKPDASELVKRILTDDEDDLMPPPESKKTLTDAQKALLKQWVAEGAVYEPHWAYTALVKPAVPVVSASAGQSDGGSVVSPTHRPAGPPSYSPIDAFIRAELTEKKLTPSSEADARTLIRRVSLDLTGLPPSPELLQRYLDPANPSHLSPQSYKALVDDLLRSPHFGERWAVWWLDAVRFADTVGFHGDQNQRIFPYRDYVINAFNSNKRFDQFTLEQVAGDLLPNPTQEQLIATGFNRLNMMTREGGAQAKEYLAKYQADRVRTIGSAWLGSGMTCCECHDHKYDPLTQRDFYSLSAFFADVKQFGVYADYGYTPNPELKGWSNDHPFPPEIEVESPFLKQRLAKLNKQMAGIATTALKNEPAASIEKWRAGLLSFLEQNPGGWNTPAPEVKTQTSTPPKKGEAKKAVAKKTAAKVPVVAKAAPVDDSKATVQSDGRILIEAKGTQTSVITLKPGAVRVAAIKIELLPDATHKDSIELNGTYNGMTLAPQFALQKPGARKATDLKPFNADADAKEPRFAGTVQAPDVKGGWKTSIAQAGKAQTSVWLFDQPADLAEGDALTVTLPNHTAGCIRVSVSAATPLRLFESGWAALLAKALKGDERTDASPAQMYLLQSGEDKTARDAWKALYAEALDCNGGKTWTQVTVAVKEPLTIHLLPRGNWQDESGPIMQPATLGIIPALAGAAEKKQNRIDLAKWLCSKENPLTPRAFTNRVWKQFFGNGLSNSIDDLGAQGEPPVNPALLDWLACEFMDSGWDFQHMVRVIVSSETYKQVSTSTKELTAADPYNRECARQSAFRLDAEIVRDNALAISGLLVPKIGGPSVKPYQPAKYWENLNFPTREWQNDSGESLYRRGMYTWWQRSFLHPSLVAFDAPSREECTAERNRSNIPQQALVLLNDPTYVESARAFAARILTECSGDAKQRIAWACQQALQRQPSADEMKTISSLFEKHLADYQKDTAAAEALLKTGAAPTPTNLNKSELAAWTHVARVLINLHETITRS